MLVKFALSKKTSLCQIKDAERNALLLKTAAKKEKTENSNSNGDNNVFDTPTVIPQVKCGSALLNKKSFLLIEQ